MHARARTHIHSTTAFGLAVAAGKVAAGVRAAVGAALGVKVVGVAVVGAGV